MDAFINGINNEVTAMRVCTVEPRTLEEAVQFTEDKCGVYAKGFKSLPGERLNDATIKAVRTDTIWRRWPLS